MENKMIEITSTKCIGKITDEDIGMRSIGFNHPRTRIAARGIVIRKDGKIAIFNKSNKNEYKLPGGGVEKDEDYHVAFQREVMEETGCKVNIIDFLGYIEEDKTNDNFKQISYVFVGEVIEDKKKLYLTKKEIDEGGKLLWVSKEKALELITNCINNIKPSQYENLYHSKFIVLRDKKIVEYYLKTCELHKKESR